MFDVVITTCGALDHDIARYFSNYLEGSFTLDDAELLEKEHSQIGQCACPYGKLWANN